MQIGQTASTHCPLMFLIFKQHFSHLTILLEPVARPTLTLTTLGPVECGFPLNLEWDERKKKGKTLVFILRSISKGERVYAS